MQKLNLVLKAALKIIIIFLNRPHQDPFYFLKYIKDQGFRS